MWVVVDGYVIEFDEVSEFLRAFHGCFSKIIPTFNPFPHKIHFNRRT